MCNWRDCDSNFLKFKLLVGRKDADTWCAPINSFQGRNSTYAEVRTFSANDFFHIRRVERYWYLYLVTLSGVLFGEGHGC
jgi:hypothetical protein